MNKIFKIYLLLLISSTYLFSQSSLKKEDNSYHKLSLDEAYIDNIKESLNNGEILLLDIDVNGGCSIMEEFPDDTISIFVEPPGTNIAEQKLILEERLLERGNEQAFQIKNRLKRFEKEMEYKEKFKSHFINDDFNGTVKEIETFIKENAE